MTRVEQLMKPEIEGDWNASCRVSTVFRIYSYVLERSKKLSEDKHCQTDKRPCSDPPNRLAVGAAGSPAVLLPLYATSIWEQVHLQCSIY